MNLILVTRLNAAGAALAEALSASCSVLVLHPDRWDLEGSFAEHRICDISEIEPNVVDTASSVVYFEESDELADMMLCMMEQSGGKPQLCLRCRSIYDENPVQTVAACICETLRADRGSKITYCDVPAVYGNDFLPHELESKIMQSRKNNTLTLEGHPDLLCDVLHVSDLASFIVTYLQKGEFVPKVAVSGSQRLPLHELVEKIREEYRFMNVIYEENGQSRVKQTETTQTSQENACNWMPEHNISEDMSGIIACLNERSGINAKSKRKIAGSNIGKILLLLGTFACLWVYTNFIKVSSELQFVDLKLLFVISMSLFLGRGYGLVAGILCSVSSIIDSLLMGYSWYTIFFHVDNWIPIAVYLASAVLFGMYNDNHRMNEGV